MSRSPLLSPAVRGGVQLAVQIALMLALFAVLQLLATRHNVRFDLTPTQSFALSPSARQIAEALDKPVRITVFYNSQSGDLRRDMADLLEQFPELKDRVGPRACILNDLSPAACHIAYNYNKPVDVDALRREFERVKAAVKDEFAWLYGTEHYEPAGGLYDPRNHDVAVRMKTTG